MNVNKANMGKIGKFIKEKQAIIILTLVFFAFSLVITQARTGNKQTEVVINPDQVNLYFFYGQGCPHCAKEEVFLDQLEKDFTTIKVHRFETWYNDENADLLDKIRRDIGFRSGVPVLLIGEEAIVGYGSDQTTGQRIRSLVSNYVESGCNDIASSYFEKEPLTSECEHICDTEGDECEHDCGCQADQAALEEESPASEQIGEVELPLIGKISAHNVALPVFTILVAAADGFNPCAMWVLLFLINLLIGMKNRTKMWILGSAFIVSSALVYFLFVFTWLQIFLFVGLVLWLRIAVATIAFGSGTFHIKEYWENRDGCSVTADEKRQKMFNRLRGIVLEKRFWLALGGIVLLAAAVNLVELVCSAGFPQAFVGVLALADLPRWQYFAYILLYIFIFMLDDLFVFVVAMSTLKLKAISDKYTHWAFLVGGVLMVVISFLLVLRPEWLSLG